MKYPLMIERHPEYDNIGFKLIGREWADPVEGLGLAHDVLEHARKDTGTIEEEFSALGASLYVRDLDDAYHQLNPMGNNDVVENLKSEFYFQTQYWDEAGYTQLAKHRGQKLKDHPEVEEILEKIARKVPAFVYNEIGGHHPLGSREQISRAITWMRQGFRRAKSQYKGIRQYNLTHAFVQIAKKADDLLRMYEEGSRFDLKIKMNRHVGDIEWEFVYVKEDYE